MPGPGHGGPVPASYVHPDLLARWAAERTLLAQRTADATARRRRSALWVGFVVACLGIIGICVVALVGPGAATGTPPGRHIVTTSSSVTAP